MRERNRQIFRFLLVLALGASLAGLAGQAARPEKPALREQLAQPEPIIMATVMERTVPEECLLVPREEEDTSAASSGVRAKTADSRESGGRPKKKVIACG